MCVCEVGYAEPRALHLRDWAMSDMRQWRKMAPVQRGNVIPGEPESRQGGGDGGCRARRRGRQQNRYDLPT